MASTPYPTSLWRHWCFRLVSILIVLAGAFFLPQFYLAERIIWHRGQSRSLRNPQSRTNETDEKWKNYKRWRNRMGMTAFVGMFWIAAILLEPKLSIEELFLTAGSVLAVSIIGAFLIMAAYKAKLRSRIQKPEVVGSSGAGADDEKREAEGISGFSPEDCSRPNDVPPDYSRLKKVFEVDRCSGMGLLEEIGKRRG